MDEQQELKGEIERVVELACRSLSPKDCDLLRWACGVSVEDRSEAWRQIEMACVE